MSRPLLVTLVALQLACGGMLGDVEVPVVKQVEVAVPKVEEDTDEEAGVADAATAPDAAEAETDAVAGPDGTVNGSLGEAGEVPAAASSAETPAPAPAPASAPATTPAPAPAKPATDANPPKPAPAPVPSDKNGAKPVTEKPATLDLQAPQVTGKLSARSVEEVMRRNKDEMKGCYARELVKVPDLKGQAVYQLNVNPDGTVNRVQLQWSRLNNPTVEMCVKGQLKKLTFEPAKEESVVVQAMTFAPA